MLANKRGNTTASGLDGVTRHYYYAPVYQEPQGELYLATGFAEDQLLAGQRSSFQIALLGFGAFALLALAVAWAVGTFSVYRPVRKLEDAAERLADGDLTARSQVSSRRDEIGALGREFDNMAESIETHVGDLQRAQGELSDLNAELETRVRRRTAELEASNKELEAFNYSVSHDLRAPLRAIDGFSQALLEDYGDRFDEEGRDHLGRVKAAANRMGELIDSLLKLSRLSRCEMVVRPVDLSAIATEVVQDLRDSEPERSVEVSIQSDVMALCDQVLLHSALENLLGNAWKFTGRTENAHIEFGSTEAEGESVYFVRDNGAGFDMAYSNKLFGAFQRLHGQGEFPGTGVGLATVGRIVWRHGGRVWAEGVVGKGATFYFTLP
jgi:signal transduction histidine kinase